VPLELIYCLFRLYRLVLVPRPTHEHMIQIQSAAAKQAQFILQQYYPANTVPVLVAQDSVHSVHAVHNGHDTVVIFR